MNAEKFVTAIEKFFLDVIGTILPGLALLAGMWAVFGPIELGRMTLVVPATDTAWTLTVIVAYVLGHALTSLGEQVVIPMVAPLGNSKYLSALTAKFADDDATVLQIKDGDAVKVVARNAYGSVPAITEAYQLRALRGVAMSLARDDTPTINRFTFIALLNMGIATALWITGLMVLGQAVWVGFRQAGVKAGSATVGAGLLIALALWTVSLIFLERRFIFYRRTMFTPFDMAVAVLSKEEKKKEPADGPAPHAAPAVYLAGGLTSTWQDTVKAAAPGARYQDPRKHGLADARAATAWSLAALEASDVVFANLEPTVPGNALAMEMGYAKALGKHVILVDEKTAADPALAGALGPLSALAHAPFPTLAEGMVYLKERLSLM